MSNTTAATVKAGELALTTRICITHDRVYAREELCIVRSISFNMAQIEYCADGYRTAKELRDLRPE